MTLSKSIIRAVCEEYGVTPTELRYTRRPPLRFSNARRDAILRLREADFTLAQIERLLGVSYSSVVYYLYPSRRALVRCCVDRRRRTEMVAA